MHHLNSILKILNPMMAGAIAAVGLSLPTFAETAPASLPTVKQPILLAQLVGQCRQTNQQVAIFSAPNCSSGASRLLPAGARVTLNANEALNGFIAIQGGGFVQTANLASCSPPPGGSTCRRVIQPNGVDVRANPNRNSVSRGRLPLNTRVTLTAVPAITAPGSDGNIWVEISAPLAGWVSNGPPGSPSNLGMCQ